MKPDQKALLDEIRTHRSEVFVGEGVTDDCITAAELTLGVTFPKSYREFLRSIGASLWPDEIFGLIEGVPNLSVVALTRQEREDVDPELPPHLIPFAGDGWGNHYCLDTESMTGYECPVVFWNHELDSNQTPRIANEDFWGWLSETVQKAVAD